MQYEVCSLLSGYIGLQSGQSVVWVHRSAVWYIAMPYEVCSLLYGYIGLQSGTLLCRMKSAVCKVFRPARSVVWYMAL